MHILKQEYISHKSVELLQATYKRETSAAMEARGFITCTHIPPCHA